MSKEKFTSEFKAKVALAAIKGVQTVSEIASEYDVHPTQIKQWKQLLLDNCQDTFSGKKDKQAAVLEQEKDRLYKRIGQLSVEVEWLKKKTGHLD
ncbi:MAG: transposase [Psychrobacter sp.]|nr:transposase [Psychrobacter sp.]